MKTPQDYLHGASPAAQHIAPSGWSILVVFLITAAVMWLLLAWLTMRRRGSFAEHAHVAREDGRTWVIVGGLVIPGIVFVVFFGMMFGVMGASSSHMSGERAAPEIRVVGQQWWFDAEYLGPHLYDNVHVPTELHIPVGRPVEIELKTLDVIHSFWIPRLQGKVDLVPGNINRVTLRADRPGLYEGQCAEFCGVQHAQMRLQVVAEPEAQYRAWLAAQRQDAVASAADAGAQHGRDVFLGAACPLCHTVRGTPAHGTVGPDLTHVGSRHRIGGGAFVNDTADLAAWITDAQSLKPGSHMPTLKQLNGGDLRDVVAYLQSLK